MRLIDADDVLELLDLMYDNQADKDEPYNVGVIGVTNYIKHRAPTIEIFRCEECKNNGKDECPMRWWNDDWLEYETLNEPEDFCSFGEREGE